MMRVELYNSIMGFDQRCTLDIENKIDGVHITVVESEHKIWKPEKVIYCLINRHAGDYDNYAHSASTAKHIANDGFLSRKIERLEKELESAKFAQKIARRNKVILHD